MAWNESGGGSKNPWDRRPPQGTDLDEVVRSWQRRLSQLFGGAGRGGAGRPPRLNWGGITLLLLVAWAATGLYRVDASEHAVITRFGRYVKTTLEGLHWHLPWPIEARQKVNVTGVASVEDRTRMLTSDENLVDITIAVQYRRADAVKFLFNVRDPETTLRDVSESAIREIIGQSGLEHVLGPGRQEITEKTLALIQTTLDSYDTGIQVSSVNLTAVSVPEQVAPAQKDAIKAREDKDRFSQEAQAYANKVVPEARGMAQRQIQDAEAYKARIVAEAQGETARFGQLLAAYQRAPEVTRQRMYLDAIENVLSRSRKVLLDTESRNNVLYLPLDKLLERDAAAGAGALMPEMSPREDSQVETVTVQPRARGER